MIKDINQEPEVIDFIKAFIRKPTGFLLLSGMNGTGKTFAAMTIYEAISPYQLPAYDSDVAIFTTQAALNIKFAKQFQGGDVEYLLHAVTTTKLLVIDDLGTRPPSTAFMDFLYLLADTRWANREKLGTIITTNLNAEDMCRNLSHAFFSRVASGKCFRFDGPDRRMDAPNSSLEAQGRIISINSQEDKYRKENARAVP